jgi:phenylacetate-CoA ligase
LGLNQHIAEVFRANPKAHRVSISSPSCNGEISYTGTPSARRRTLGNTRFVSLSRFPFLLGEEELDRMVREALEWDPVFLDTDPVYAVVFALHCERKKIRFPRLKFVLTSYEYTSVLHKAILSRVFGVPVYNLYGSTETGHLIMENEKGEMVPSPDIAYLTVANPDSRGVGEVVVYTLTNDYMPLLNYQIGDLVARSELDGKVTYVLHGRSADTPTTVDGRRVTVRDIDQCFIGVEGVAHYRLHEPTPRHFTLSYILDANKAVKGSPSQALAKLNALLKPAEAIEAHEVKFLLPEGSGKFVLSYPFIKQ